MPTDFATMPSILFVKLFKLLNEYGQVQPWEMIPVRDVDFSSMQHRQLTCVRHPWSRYTTKNPFERSIFCMQGIHGMSSSYDVECECPFSDMRVVK